MKRNIEKNIDLGGAFIKKDTYADMTASELDYFKEAFIRDCNNVGTFNAIFNIVSNVYKLGVATGVKYQKRQAR